MLPKSFYTLVDTTSTDNLHHFILELNAGHAVYAGHFPHHAVVPGVCTLGMIRDCAELLSGRPLEYETIREVKFLSAILPEKHHRIVVELYLAPAGGEAYGVKCRVLDESRHEIMLKMKATLR